MSATVILGAQWGDEGKGKVVDTIAKEYDYVVRYQGGNNAGHTVVRGDTVYKFHLLPSGILEKDKICILGNGTVIDCHVLLDEIAGLASQGLSAANLKISTGAHMIMPWHVEADRLQELARGAEKIGTTGRGIGPCYCDKVSRKGLRMVDLLDQEGLETKIRTKGADAMQSLSRLYQQDVEFDMDQMVLDYQKVAAKLAPYIMDTAKLLQKGMRQGKKALLEGAQGTLLDLDFGSYPFVTSSSPTSGGACTGSGIAPTYINRVVGVAKAYTTRVGEGPFMTEGNEKEDEWLRTAGGEFGTTTGRPRRCGWLDLVMLAYAADLNGLTEIALTKMDVLSGLAKIKVCVAYDDEMPVYEELQGWDEDISHLTRYEDLPIQAQTYVDFIETELAMYVSMIGVGQRQDQIIIR